MTRITVKPHLLFDPVEQEVFLQHLARLLPQTTTLIQAGQLAMRALVQQFPAGACGKASLKTRGLMVRTYFEALTEQERAELQSRCLPAPKLLVDENLGPISPVLRRYCVLFQTRERMEAFVTAAASERYSRVDLALNHGLDQQLLFPDPLNLVGLALAQAVFIMVRQHPAWSPHADYASPETLRRALTLVANSTPALRNLATFRVDAHQPALHPPETPWPIPAPESERRALRVEQRRRQNSAAPPTPRAQRRASSGTGAHPH